MGQAGSLHQDKTCLPLTYAPNRHRIQLHHRLVACGATLEHLACRRTLREGPEKKESEEGFPLALVVARQIARHAMPAAQLAHGPPRAGSPTLRLCAFGLFFFWGSSLGSCVLCGFLTRCTPSALPPDPVSRLIEMMINKTVPSPDS